MDAAGLTGDRKEYLAAPTLVCALIRTSFRSRFRIHVHSWVGSWVGSRIGSWTRSGARSWARNGDRFLVHAGHCKLDHKALRLWVFDIRALMSLVSDRSIETQRRPQMIGADSQE